MARIVAYIPDLLFGSTVVESLRAARYEPILASDLDAARQQLVGAAVLIVDLTFDAAERIERVRLLRPAGVKTLAFYSHVETDVRERAQQAGFDLVVPRSRMAREGAALVDGLLAADQ